MNGFLRAVREPTGKHPQENYSISSSWFCGEFSNWLEFVLLRIQCLFLQLFLVNIPIEFVLIVRQYMVR